MTKVAKSCSLTQILVFYLIFLCQKGWTAEEHNHAHESVSRGEIVTEIAEVLSVTRTNSANKTIFSLSDMNRMFSNLGFVDCRNTQRSSHCQMCLTANDLYRLYNVSLNSQLTNHELQEILPGVIYLLLPVKSQTPCNVTDVRLQKKIPSSMPVTLPKVYAMLLQGYGEGKPSLHEESVETMLEQINGTIHTRLTEKKCFDVDEVIKGANVSENAISEHDFEYVSAYIVWKILGKHCIAKHVPSLPAKDFFLDRILSEFGSNGVMTFAKFEELLKKLKIGGEAKSKSSDPHSHDHRRKRSIDELDAVNTESRDASTVLRRSRREALTPSQTSTFAKKCYTPENIFKIHGYKEASGVNKTQFKELCPSIVQQIESGACASASSHNEKGKQKDWKPWVASLVSVTIISLSSLIGIVAAPLNRKSYFSKILTTFIGLGIGTLLGDAVLHLFPHSLGLHDHSEGEHKDVKDSSSYLWKSLVFIAAVYCFYLFEAIMHSLSEHGHSHGLEDTHKHIGRMPSHHKDVKGGLELNAQEREKHRNLVKGPSGVHQCESTSSIVENGHTFNSEVDIKQQEQQPNGDLPEKQPNGKVKGKGSIIRNFKAIVLMVLFGDALHNFVDGIAIGAAFTEKFPSGLYGGISTSIAIFCHELPHELGDFAILLSSGMSIKMALCLNFVSSLTAVAGVFVGVATGQQLNALPWIFAFTAGLFVYIALVDMLPELLHSKELRKNPGPIICLQSFGMLFGFLLLLILGLYEEDIKTSV